MRTFVEKVECFYNRTGLAGRTGWPANWPFVRFGLTPKPLLLVNRTSESIVHKNRRNELDTKLNEIRKCDAITHLFVYELLSFRVSFLKGWQETHPTRKCVNHERAVEISSNCT